MSKRKFFQHLPHYLPLVGIYFVGTLAFVLFSYDRQFQIGIAFAVAVAHVTWGLIHHYLHHDLSFEIMLEYFVISAVGLTVLLSVILRT